MSKKNARKKRKADRTFVRCPYCGSRAVLRSADGIYRDNTQGDMLYVCKNYPECDSYVKVQRGSNLPLGSLANKKLREMRKEAHYHFNKLYESGLITKESAYDWLAGLLGVPLTHAHIGQLGEYDCKYVVEESQKYMARERKRRMKKKKGNAA